jgi:hypothetical protein
MWRAILRLIFIEIVMSVVLLFYQKNKITNYYLPSYKNNDQIIAKSLSSKSRYVWGKKLHNRLVAFQKIYPELTYKITNKENGGNELIKVASAGGC